MRTRLAAVALVAALSGCATAGAGGAGPAPTATVATNGDLLIDSIDAQNMRTGDLAEARTRFVVAAGRRQLGVSRHTLGRGFAMNRAHFEYATVCIEAAAGHVYTARSLVRPDGTWTTDVYDHTASAAVATTCAPVPEPFVAGEEGGDGSAPPATPAAGAAPAPVVAGLTAPINDRRPHRPGTGPVIQVGQGFGGDAVPGTPGGGDQDAGGGALLAVAGTITPFWNARDFGLGADLELGWKGNPLFGGGPFSRFPLRATVHALVRLSGSWYVRLAVGAEKHFAGRIARDNEPDVSVQGSLGPAGDAGLYVIMTRHLALEPSLRYARLHYTDATATIDGSSVGFVLGMHYNVRAF